MITKEAGEKLGMHIKGGRRGQKGNPLDHTDEGVFISKINSGGAAKRDGRLKVSTFYIFILLFSNFNISIYAEAPLVFYDRLE